MLLLGVLIGESSREIKVRTSAFVVLCERVGLVVEVAVVVEDTETTDQRRPRVEIPSCKAGVCPLVIAKEHG
jgi:F420-0:gamma-glutamyl ligase